MIERPLWAEVEQAIRRLNGSDYNDLYLERPDQKLWASAHEDTLSAKFGPGLARARTLR